MEALDKCDLVVVSDIYKNTETTAYANILLPATPWGEKSGTVTNSERCISLMKSFLPPSGEAKADWWMIQEVAKKMGFGEGFNFNSPADIFREHARLSGYCNDGKRDFDISALESITDDEYDNLSAIQWPIEKKTRVGTSRMFTDGQFFTNTKKAQILALKYIAPKYSANTIYPFILNTGRIRSQWHSMTRTGLSSKLNSFIPEPLISIHPEDAKEIEAKSGDIVEIKSEWGVSQFRCDLTDTQRSGEVFVSMHWAGKHTSHGRINLLVNPAIDPVSHQPEMKHTPVSIKKIKMNWHGFIVSQQKISTEAFDYWVVAKMSDCYLYEISGLSDFKVWQQKAKSLFAQTKSQIRWLESDSTSTEQYQIARLIDDRLDTCFFVARNPILESRKWIMAAFKEKILPDDIRKKIISVK